MSNGIGAGAEPGSGDAGEDVGEEGEPLYLGTGFRGVLRCACDCGGCVLLVDGERVTPSGETVGGVPNGEGCCEAVESIEGRRVFLFTDARRCVVAGPVPSSDANVEAEYERRLGFRLALALRVPWPLDARLAIYISSDGSAESPELLLLCVAETERDALPERYESMSSWLTPG